MLITLVMERKDFSSYLEGRIHKHIFRLIEHVYLGWDNKNGMKAIREILNIFTISFHSLLKLCYFKDIVYCNKKSIIYSYYDGVIVS